MDVKKLADDLVDAEKAHKAYEEANNIQDKNWPDWYARFLIAKWAKKNAA